MALINCKSCSKEVSKNATSCPHCGEPLRKGKKKTSLLTWLVAILIVPPIVYGIFSDSKNPTGNSAKTNPGTTAKAPAAPAETITHPRMNWATNVGQDDMTGDTIKFARVESTNSVHFEFPYHTPDGSKLAISARKKGDEFDMYLTVDKGQLMCGAIECTFDLKVDDGPVETWTGLPTTSHNSETMFIRDAKQFESIVKQGKHLKIRLDFYQAGGKTFDFDTSEYPGVE